jgi:hypothetical protein
MSLPPVEMSDDELELLEKQAREVGYPDLDTHLTCVANLMLDDDIDDVDDFVHEDLRQAWLEIMLGRGVPYESIWDDSEDDEDK